jgi:hypothetical protein
MPLGYPNYTSSDTLFVGSRHTRLGSPVLVGHKQESTAHAAIAAIIGNVSTALMDIIPGTTANVVLATGDTSPTGFTYISVTTIAATSTDGLSIAAPNTRGYNMVVPLVWSIESSTLMVYSTTAASWLSLRSVSTLPSTSLEVWSTV